MRAMFAEAQVMAQMPEVMRFFMAHFESIFMAILILSLAALVASISLLKRQNWARYAFIVLLGLGVLWNIGSVLIQSAVMDDMAAVDGLHEADLPFNLPAFITTMQAMSWVFAGALSLFFLWLIKKLVSNSVKEEFDAV